ncbi:beta strand repeat-containing protein [Candidatus Skiveiella danica]|uniref:beta strand repeat-containing protein n=1 Tax=Candidatus Skiveiella danica TaxID=3386177 RepID=UPI0039B99F5F
MSQPTVFGASQAVTMMNLALYGGSYVLSPAEFANQANQATDTASGQYAYANLIAQPASVLSTDAYVTLVLGHMGVDANPLHDAVVAYMDSVGVANRGTVTLQLGQILSGLTLDGTYGAAANAWNALVSANFAEWTGTAPVPGSNVAMTTTANELVVGTGGDDKFSGSTNTYQGGDTVRGGGGHDVLMLSLTSGTYNNVTTQGVNRIEIDADGDVTVGASKFSTELQSILITNKSTGNMVLNDLQEDSRNSIMFELNDVAADVTLNFDQQAVQGASTVEVMLTEVTGALALVGENGEAIETTILNVQDVKGAASTLKSLSVTGGTTLEIKGGLAGQAFTITAPLPSTLTTVNAASAAGVFAGNLVLDVTGNGASKALALTGGSGDDKINIGDGYGDGDVLNGGAGADEITINFTTSADTTRAAAMTKFETANVAFNAPVSFEGAAVDDLKTINLNASTSRADFNQMDSTLDTLNIKANPAQGVEVDYDGKAFSTLNINIQDKTSAIGNAGNKAAIRVLNADVVNLTHAGAAAVALTNGLQLDDRVSNGRSTTDLNIQNQSDFNLTINGMNNGGSPARLSAVIDSNDVERVTVQTNKQGDILAGNSSVAFMEEANALQNLTIISSIDGDIELGLIGNRDFFGDYGDNPDDLETVTIDAAISSAITQWGIDADDAILNAGASAATVNTISVKGAASSIINLFGSGHVVNDLVTQRATSVSSAAAAMGQGAGPGGNGFNWLQAASVGVVDINSSGLSVFGSVAATQDNDGDQAPDTNLSNLIGFSLNSQQDDSRIVMAGSANMPGVIFDLNPVEHVDISGLTNKTTNHTVNLGDILIGASADNYTLIDGSSPFSGVTQKYSVAVIANDEFYQPATKSLTVNGSAMGDIIFGTNGDDQTNMGILAGNGGDDLIVGWGGNDNISGGDGSDVLFGDAINPNRGNASNATAFGNDIIDGGSGNDLIIGGANKSGGGDLLTGGAGRDTFAWVFEDTPSLDNVTLPTVQNNPANGYTEAGKSTAAIKQDVVTDFTPGDDLIQVDSFAGGDNTYTILYFFGQGSNGVVQSNGGLDIQIVIRRGNYNSQFGTFNLDANGADLQVLFADDGDDFGPLALNDGGFSAFTAAQHEIALLGAGQHIGSIAHSDFLFI